MVKNILSLFIAVLICGLSSAQVQKFKLMKYGTTTDLTGTVIDVDITTTDEIHYNLLVENISGGTMDVVASRTIISAPSNWLDQVCFGANCFDIGDKQKWTMASGDAYTMNDGQSSVSEIKINPATPNNAIYRYYFGTSQDPFQDSVDIKVNNVLSVKEFKKDFTLNVSPNPANDYLTIKAGGIESANLKMMDVLGNVILSESFSGYKTINTSTFKNGVYFVLISGNGVASTNRKVVIRH
ncbi:MAG: T9SS type A sorting domain-containing protein [Bacteroidetes bacterium]|nr:T9SS type A sorting domain-containing protein [Bacteroidota bacterium]